MRKLEDLLLPVLLIVEVLLIILVVLASASPFAPTGYTIDQSFLNAVKTQAIIASAASGAGIIALLGLFVTIPYLLTYSKGNITPAKNIIAVIFIVGSIIFAGSGAMKYANATPEVHTFKVEGRRTDIEISPDNILYNLFQRSKRRKIGRGYELKDSVTTVYYLKFEGDDCRTDFDNYIDANDGDPYYVITLGTDCYACYSPAEHAIDSSLT